MLRVPLSDKYWILNCHLTIQIIGWLFLSPFIPCPLTNETALSGFTSLLSPTTNKVLSHFLSPSFFRAVFFFFWIGLSYMLWIVKADLCSLLAYHHGWWIKSMLYYCDSDYYDGICDMHYNKCFTNYDKRKLKLIWWIGFCCFIWCAFGDLSSTM